MNINDKDKLFYTDDVSMIGRYFFSEECCDYLISEMNNSVTVSPSNCRRYHYTPPSYNRLFISMNTTLPSYALPVSQVSSASFDYLLSVFNHVIKLSSDLVTLPTVIQYIIQLHYNLKCEIESGNLIFVPTEKIKLVNEQLYTKLSSNNECTLYYNKLTLNSLVYILGIIKSNTRFSYLPNMVYTVFFPKTKYDSLCITGNLNSFIRSYSNKNDVTTDMIFKPTHNLLKICMLDEHYSNLEYLSDLISTMCTTCIEPYVACPVIKDNPDILYTLRSLSSIHWIPQYDLENASLGVENFKKSRIIGIQKSIQTTIKDEDFCNLFIEQCALKELDFLYKYPLTTTLSSIPEDEYLFTSLTFSEDIYSVSVITAQTILQMFKKLGYSLSGNLNTIEPFLFAKAVLSTFTNFSENSYLYISETAYEMISNKNILFAILHMLCCRYELELVCVSFIRESFILSCDKIFNSLPSFLKLSKYLEMKKLNTHNKEILCFSYDSYTNNDYIISLGKTDFEFDYESLMLNSSVLNCITYTVVNQQLTSLSGLYLSLTDTDVFSTKIKISSFLGHKLCSGLYLVDPIEYLHKQWKSLYEYYVDIYPLDEEGLLSNFTFGSYLNSVAKLLIRYGFPQKEARFVLLPDIIVLYNSNSDTYYIGACHLSVKSSFRPVEFNNLSLGFLASALNRDIQSLTEKEIKNNSTLQSLTMSNFKDTESEVSDLLVTGQNFALSLASKNLNNKTIRLSKTYYPSSRIILPLSDCTESIDDLEFYLSTINKSLSDYYTFDLHWFNFILLKSTDTQSDFISSCPLYLKDYLIGSNSSNDLSDYFFNKTLYSDSENSLSIARRCSGYCVSYTQDSFNEYVKFNTPVSIHPYSFSYAEKEMNFCLGTVSDSDISLTNLREELL